MKEETKKVKKLLYDNRYRLGMVVLIYQSTLIAIGLVNFPYLDDAARQLNGRTDFAFSYSRWGSEIASWFVQGSRHLTDLGLTTPILTGCILAITSILAVYILNNKKLEWVPLACSTIIGLNPWFLQCVSFRFDSPYLALSLFFSIFPFLWWCNKTIFFCLSFFSVFAMCNTYQSSSGIYIVMVLTLGLRDLLSDTNIKELMRNVLIAAVSYFLGMFLFLFEMRFNPELSSRGGTTQIAGIFEMPQTIVKNIYNYFGTILTQSAKIWIVLTALIFILFLIKTLFASQKTSILTIIITCLYLVLAAVFSYGVLLVFSESLATWNPRYAYGFGVFVAIIMIRLTSKNEFKSINWVSKGISLLFTYYLISFVFTYAVTLEYQKESLEKQSVILATDLKTVLSDENKNIYMNRFFNETPILLNSEINYPILRALIPRNSDLYFINQIILNTYTGVGVSITPIPEEFDQASAELVLSNIYYDIYSKDKSLYIFMK
ncbi:glucosyltransferase domain-containing protein [Enterococcus sp. AZ109]|uniref:glucosyltransferase domain-containing protein n=1 Tax=Enterococcus sp. AZ109 TaxID=2774634 RepID=UPI003F1EDAC1